MMDERCFHVTVKGLVFDEHGGVWRLVLCFAIELESLEFTESEECVGYRFVGKGELESLSIAPHIQLLATWL